MMELMLLFMPGLAASRVFALLGRGPDNAVRLAANAGVFSLAINVACFGILFLKGHAGEAWGDSIKGIGFLFKYMGLASLFAVLFPVVAHLSRALRVSLVRERVSG